MKQAILTFEKQSVLLVELPEGATNVKMYRPFKKYFHLSCDLPPNREGVHTIFGTCFPYKNFGGKKNYPSEILLIGKLSELTEEVFAEIVDTNVNSYGKGYRHYWKDNGFVPRGFNAIHKSAMQSFLSKLRAEGFTTQETPKVLRDSENALSAEELERNFQPSRTYLFKIVKQ